MRRRTIFSPWAVAICVPAVLMFGAGPAKAQPATDVRLSPVEVSFGLTVNAVTPDVNTPPHCVQLSLPCTHARAEKFGGFGLTVAIAGNLSDRFAIAGDFSTFKTSWDVTDAASVVRATTRVKSFGVGPRVSTRFFHPGNNDRHPGRFFGQFLVGGETASAVSVRPSLLLGGGADFMVAQAGPRPAGSSRALTLRWSLDYRFSPGARRSFSGYRFTFGIVFGPMLL